MTDTSRHVKPFRTIEDIHVLGAAAAYLIGMSRRAGAPPELLAALGSALLALDPLSTAPPLDARVHLLLHGVYQRLLALVDGKELAAVWQAAPEEERARWQRDRPLLDVAARARRARFERATQELL